ncbi:MAG: hypothetical protein KGI27_15270, partial [Thaumarchaeota archaeon]|nr:hypothetical protein [Nitrososphaerota archaeon]
MKIHLAVIVILVITSIVSNVSVFADNGTLRLGPPPKIPVRQVYPSPCCDGYATTWPNIRGISLTLIGTEHRLGSTLTL